jgi:hypothetical protein
MGKFAIFWRDLKIVAKAVWINLLLFMAILALAVVLLRLSVDDPQTSWLQLLVDAFHLAVIERVVEPGAGALPMILTFVMPLLTLVILGEGVLRVLSTFIARGEHREEWDRMVAKTFSDHIVICGVGELGRALVQQLLEANPSARMVLVDPRPGVIAELGLNSPNICHIVSDMTTLEALETANCREAALIILSSGNDAFNLEAAFKVLQINPDAQIWIRLYRGQLAELFEHYKKPNVHFFCPYQEAAQVLIGHIRDRTGE